MALSSNALTTYAAARDALGLSNDDPESAKDILERIINAVSSAMSKRSNRQFHRQTVTAERHGTNGSPRLCLKVCPVISVSSVTINAPDGTVYDTVTTTSYYIEDADAGFLAKPSGWANTAFLPFGIGGTGLNQPDEPEKRIRVTYVGGWITPEQARLDSLLPVPLGLVRDLPQDIEDACIQSVVSVFRRDGQDRNVIAENSQTVSKSWRETSDVLTPETRSVCHSYANYV